MKTSTFPGVRYPMRPLSALLLLFFVLGASPGPKIRARAPRVYVEKALRPQIAIGGIADKLQAIVNFDRSVTSRGVLARAIHNLGVGTVTFNNLDSIGVLATTSQISAISSLRGVSGIYANRQLKFLMPEANSYVGADTAWNSLGITGKGVGVAILDSGIDGTHADLAFGPKTVQNAKILFDPAEVFSTADEPGATPLFVEGLADTDTSSGHGTHVAGIAAGNGTASGGYDQ